MKIVYIAEYQANDGCYHREIFNRSNRPAHLPPIERNGKVYYFFRYLVREQLPDGQLKEILF